MLPSISVDDNIFIIIVIALGLNRSLMTIKDRNLSHYSEKSHLCMHIFRLLLNSHIFKSRHKVIICRGYDINKNIQFLCTAVWHLDGFTQIVKCCSEVA